MSKEKTHPPEAVPEKSKTIIPTPGGHVEKKAAPEKYFRNNTKQKEDKGPSNPSKK